MRSHELAVDGRNRAEEAHHEIGGRLVIDLSRRGDLLAIRVDRDDPSKVAVDWANAPVRRRDTR